MELLTLTSKELERIRTLQRVEDGGLSQIQAAQSLGLSVRQVRRLAKALGRDGPRGVLSRRRGATPNNRLNDALRASIIERCRGPYRGFGPTFLAQTLTEHDGITVSREWLRALMIEQKLWRPRARHRNIHPLRERRPRFGELVQMDGSPHDWFEERGPRCSLLLAIDDATGCITSGRFEPAETTDGYFRLLDAHLLKFGRFCAAYTDKHSIFRYSGSSTDQDVVTQLQRALDELDIELICANSPQAKGRVERANRTLQDRLIKAMRLAAISTIDAGNAFLPHFIDDHNCRFAVNAALDQDAHRSIEGLDLRDILCRKDQRLVTKNLMFQLEDHCFKLVDPYSRRHLVSGSRLTILRHHDGHMTVRHADHILEVQAVGKLVRNAPIVGAKDLNEHLNRRIPDPRKVRKPAANHPWKTFRPPPPAA